MKDLDTVLRQKEQELQRVRKELRALQAVIPLLADEQSALRGDVNSSLPYSETTLTPPDDDMAQLELYYPFVRHLRGLAKSGSRMR